MRNPKTPDIDLAWLRTRLRYEPDTGRFFYKIASENVKVGQEAGWVERTGYRRIRVKGEPIIASRLAWFYVNGKWPSALIDHINGDRSDNRIENLRDVTFKDNMRNRRLRADNTTGFCGVRKNLKGKKFRGFATGERRESVRTGSYDSPEEAYAELRARISTHGYHENHGAMRPQYPTTRSKG